MKCPRTELRGEELRERKGIEERIDKSQYEGDRAIQVERRVDVHRTPLR